ncbi:MAG: non-heme iron oxygenase ferredoxin subunit [Gammaproteobacteria bacterium]|nr:non-heme iron oxygenase ferredoxin subunit [Gammaproteobacteria bacterium]
MTDWIDVTHKEELTPGTWKVVDVDDVMVAVFNVDGEYFAIEDVCTHDGGELTGGAVYHDVIECPRHGARFCLRTGEVLEPPAYEPVDVFPVRIDGDMVQVRDDRWD